VEEIKERKATTGRVMSYVLQKQLGVALG